MYLPHFIIEADTIKVVGFWVFWATKSLVDEKKILHIDIIFIVEKMKNHLLRVIEMFLKNLCVEK